MINSFDRNLRLGYGFSIIVLITVSLVSWLTLNSLINSNRAVVHSSEVMQKLEQLLSTMKDAETGQRGYLLTGQLKYLQPFNGANKQAAYLAVEIRGLTADNPVQQKNLKEIESILRQRLNIFQQLVVKKQNSATILSDDLEAGKAAMDALRNAVRKAEYDERILLKSRQERFGQYTDLVPPFILFALIMALGITFYSYRNVTGQVTEREKLRRNLEQSEEETQALNEELTAANEEITAANEELTSINEELAEARDELVAVNESLEVRVTQRTQALQKSEQETQALNEELMAMNEEITATNEELQSANEELRQADERSAKLAAIVESSDDAIIGKDLDGIITAWNRGAEIIFGYREEEVIGGPILKLVPAHLHHEEPLILDRLRKGEKIDHYETIRQTADGRQINVSLTISPIKDKEGKVIGVSKIARDITEQKRDEERKNDFIGMASHELKTPLTSMTALVQVLQQKLKDSTDPFIPQALAKTALQAKKMGNLINGFLNVSRLESGKLEIVKNRFELCGLIDEYIDEMRLTASSHKFIFEDRTSIFVDADREKIGSVVSNLLSNAVKYSPKGELITIKCQTAGVEAQFSVQDEGLGIRAQDKIKIFDRYYRAIGEGTKNISGFGVGLYLSAEIIERHEGRIWVESENGTGSTFFFSLPIA
ncbi:PAS domain S-box protein [Mucilaginibacter conchicola]|uniref:histidine kinase n=1 Tax=Mucilaginibacter conchicola TaxID=2303333 RepID=A0A372NPA4_9SPHI|nr:CHASE3 domain-containing protein [Mucilaginibacter conchicola]RFZ90073.1 PAS domain S-box protein [Mucilaginibacter conchicola]